MRTVMTAVVVFVTVPCLKTIFACVRIRVVTVVDIVVGWIVAVVVLVDAVKLVTEVVLP